MSVGATTQTIAVSHQSDVGAARRAARSMAERLGFDEKSAEEIALAVTELATNLLKHAGDGELQLTPLDEAGRRGLEVSAQDDGPGIADVERAVADRFSTRTGSRGVGLGAVNRLMHDFHIESRPGAGTRVLCRKWLRAPQTAGRSCPLAVGIASRPHPRCRDNGDAFVLKEWNESILVGVIDGLGHGQFAHRASLAARTYVDSHHELPLEQIFAGVGRACRGTRGVVMALARLDWGREKLTYASIGDIELRVFPRRARFSVPIQRGILGLNAPTALVTEHHWQLSNVMVLHSDGLRTHWAWEDFPDLASKPAAETARSLLSALARENDDATVVVVRRVLP